MADDDRTRPEHAQNMSSIDPPVLNERIVWVDASKNRLVAGFGCDTQDAMAEDSGTRTEEVILSFFAGGHVCSVDLFVDGGDLLGQYGGGKGDAWFVVHRVVSKFVAGFHDVVQDVFVARHLVADDEEGCVHSIIV